MLGVVGAVAWLAAGQLEPATAEDLDPPLVGLEDHQDEHHIVSLKLPRRAKTIEAMPLAGKLAAWGVWVDDSPAESPHFFVGVHYKTGFRRAGLCGDLDRRPRYGETVADSIERGDGIWQERRLIESESKLFVWRLVQHEEHVFELFAQTHPGSYANGLSGHIDFVLASFRVVGTPPTPPVPAGCVERAADGRVVFSDSKDRIETTRALKTHDSIWSRMAEVLPGEPFLSALPTVVLLENAGTYHSLAARSGYPESEPPPFAFVDYDRTATVVRLASARERKPYLAAIREVAAMQYVRRYFGGPTPTWIDDGLSRYAAARLRAKSPDALPNALRVAARAAAKRRPAGLDELLGQRLAEAARREDIAAEAVAWHAFFREGAGAADYGSVYARYLALLRETGDLVAARATWKDVDFTELRAAFDTWLAAWTK